ncbi:MAG: MarR family winged helix-turn-helix transcriptional regulator [Pseudoxanthomonas sp.]
MSDRCSEWEAASAGPSLPAAQTGQSATPGPSLALLLENAVRTVAALLRSDEARQGFTPSEWLVLSELEKTTSLPLNELAVRANTSVGGTSRVIRKLSVLRLAEWRKAPSNRRQYEIAITAQGRDVHATLAAQATRKTSEAIERISDEELLLAVRILTRCMPEGVGGKKD